MGGGHHLVAALLLDKGADKDSKNKDGNTALHLAARDGKQKVAAHLIEQGAETDTQNNQGNTALHMAAAKGRNHGGLVLVDRGYAIVRTLLENGASKSIINKAGKTAQQRVPEGSDAEELRKLLRLG